MVTTPPEGNLPWPPVVALYAVSIRNSIVSGDVGLLKLTLAEAQKQNSQIGDIRSALAVARAALAKAKQGG
ncbi:DUF1843 domain-containing protein [Niveispirillum sp. SYP-B3756]|uniref:DUF1843 domain-containing protein n=1 Tax=Niveispirillum sp. SYP-B3756 TaxID=2662178 RepID=UPI0012924F6A|nr:DUF1843 domain-containing protein [Niveispirillum sp. SYP-B3756]MQP67445.1 DUF1843 domain-containing protein [Niveispirillum sp. SYP-B3756]